MGGESEWIIQLHSVLIHQLQEFIWANLQEDQVAIVVVITVAIIAVVEAMVVVVVIDAVLDQDRSTIVSWSTTMTFYGKNNFPHMWLKLDVISRNFLD